MYRDHSGELMPIIAACAPSCQRPAALADELLAHVVPDLLGVDDHAVEIEDDALDHADRYSPPSTQERRSFGARLGALDASDEERVVARLVLALELALEPADGAGEQRRARSLQDLDPLPERDRRHTAGEVLRERDLIGSEQRDPEASCGAEQLVESRLAADRDRRRAEARARPKRARRRSARGARLPGRR